MAINSNTYGKLLAVLLSMLGFSVVVSSCAKYGAPVCQGDDFFRPQITPKE